MQACVFRGSRMEFRTEREMKKQLILFSILDPIPKMYPRD